MNEPIIMNKKPRLKKPCLLVAWPGMGEVAFKAAEFLIHELKAQEFARLKPEEFFYLNSSVITEGILGVPLLPEGKFYYWKNPQKGPGKNDLVVFLSNAQPDLAKADSYCRLIIELARELGVESVVSFASMPLPNDHTQEPGVWFAATDARIKETLKKSGFSPLADGQISGMNGLFLGIAKKSGLKGFCLLGEIPLYTIQIENPKASAAVLEALVKVLDLPLNLAPLKEQGQAMENEINKLLDYLKVGGSGSPGPIGEEEVELIKKTLSQLSNLPVSVKERIEKLFEESRKDITRAKELKAELDKWNVYKEYEDKFLDLFRKNKDAGN